MVDVTMCIQLFLIASHRLPTVENSPDYSDLAITAIAESGLYEAIHLITPAPFVYAVRPSEQCGCFFHYEDRAEFKARLAEVDGTLAGATAREKEEALWQQAYSNSPSLLRHLSKHDSAYVAVQEWIWWQGYNSVTSFARYLTQHIGDTPFALYVAWERDEGKALRARHTITPSFFGGSSFEQLPVDTLFTIVKESTASSRRFNAKK